MRLHPGRVKVVALPRPRPREQSFMPPYPSGKSNTSVDPGLDQYLRSPRKNPTPMPNCPNTGNNRVLVAG
eukprot:9973708-Lingulodinium_polyedra.AAC.1